VEACHWSPSAATVMLFWSEVLSFLCPPLSLLPPPPFLCLTRNACSPLSVCLSVSGWRNGWLSLLRNRLRLSLQSTKRSHFFPLHSPHAPSSALCPSPLSTRDSCHGPLPRPHLRPSCPSLMSLPVPTSPLPTITSPLYLISSSALFSPPRVSYFPSVSSSSGWESTVPKLSLESVSERVFRPQLLAWLEESWESSGNSEEQPQELCWDQLYKLMAGEFIYFYYSCLPRPVLC
jgi:hypothetical protein